MYMQQLTITVWKLIFRGLVCDLIPCAVNWKEFSNIIVSRHGHMHMYAWSAMAFKFQKNKKMIKKTWNLAWCNVMPPRWCGKKIGLIDESLETPLTNRSNSLEGSWFWEGTMHVWWRTGDSFLLQPSIFYTFNMH